MPRLFSVNVNTSRTLLRNKVSNFKALMQNVSAYKPTGVLAETLDDIRKMGGNRFGRLLVDARVKNLLDGFKLGRGVMLTALPEFLDDYFEAKGTRVKMLELVQKNKGARGVESFDLVLVADPKNIMLAKALENLILNPKPRQ